MRRRMSWKTAYAQDWDAATVPYDTSKAAVRNKMRRLSSPHRLLAGGHETLNDGASVVIYSDRLSALS
jgi:hypothetical protein